MKSQTLIIVAFLVVLSCFGGAQADIGYNYCGKPCTDPSGMVCGYNQACFEVFINRCAMKDRNCNMGTRFNEAAMSSCLMGRKC